MSTQPLPPIEYPNLKGILPPQAELAVRVAYENLFYLRQRDLRALISPLTKDQINQIKQEINPPGPPGPPGPGSGEVLVGTHAIRLTTYPSGSQPLGQLYYETDRSVMYIVSNATGINLWVYDCGIMTGTFAQRPADLGTYDVGFFFHASDLGRSFRWSGSAWTNYTELGITLSDTHANRSTYPPATYPVGVLYYETDRTVLYTQKGGNWIYLTGIYYNTFANIPGDLGVNDTGFLFYATDRRQSYYWDGTKWIAITTIGSVLVDIHDNRSASGTVDTSGTAVTWDSGTVFNSSWVGHLIYIGGAFYQISAFTDSHHITLLTGAGVQTAVNFQFTIYPSVFYQTGVQFWETDRTVMYLALNSTGTVNVNAGGVVSTSGTSVTWVSGDKFKLAWTGAITINGVGYVISTVNSATSITLTGSAGTQTGVYYSYTNDDGTFVTWVSGDKFDVYWNTGTMFIALVGSVIANVIDTQHLNVSNSFTKATSQPYYVPGGKWTYEDGVMAGTISPNTKPIDLGVNDTNFLFNSTDFDRIYRWTGTVWTDAPAQPQRDVVHMCRTAPAGNGWQACDGSAAIKISKSDGTTALITVPLLTGGTFPRGGASYTGPSPTSPVAPGISGDTADAPTGGSVSEGLGTVIDGTGSPETVLVSATFVEGIHHHGVGTLVADAGGLPQYMDFLAYLRL